VSRKVSLTGEIETDGFIETQVPAGQKIDFTFDIDEPKTVIKYVQPTTHGTIPTPLNESLTIIPGGVLKLRITILDSPLIIPRKGREVQKNRKWSTRSVE